MIDNIIFCSNCGTQIKYNNNICSCGYSMELAEKQEIKNKLQKVNNDLFIDNSLKQEVCINHEQLSNYNLSGLYLISSSIKDDYKSKVNFLKAKIIPSVNNWKKGIEEAEQNLAKDKVEVYGRIVGITDFVLKEFFGPFTIKENSLQNFIEFRNFGKYELYETMIESNLDFTDIQTTNFGDVGSSVMKSIGNTLQHGYFKELSQKTKWTKSDINTVKTEIGIAVAGALIDEITNIINQNTKEIKQVRIADKKLNEKIGHISNVINSLTIEENEIEKQKRLYDKSDVILDTCFNKILKPIVKELNNDPVYIEYKKERKPFDLEQQKITLDEEALNTEVKVPFWKCLLSSKSKNYKHYRNKRMKSLNILKKYSEINEELGEKNHKTLEEFYKYREIKTSTFKEFEKINRRKLKELPAISKNKETVIKFAGVLKQVKSNLNTINNEKQ